MTTHTYKVEVTTEIPVVISNDDLKEGKTFYQVMVDKAVEVLGTMDMNKEFYEIKLTQEFLGDTTTKEKEN